MTLGAIVAVVAAIAYGAADFCGGLASRRASTTAVLFVAQIVGFVALAPILVATHARVSAADLPYAVLAACAGVVGIGLLYAALAVGRMGVVSPITAVVGATVPVVASALAGERISAVAIAGCVVALAAIVAITTGGEILSSRASSWLHEPGVAYALASGVAIGIVYVAFTRGPGDGRLAIVAEMRLVSIPLLAFFATVRRLPLFPPRAALGLVAVAGVLDMGANALFVVASRLGPLSIAAVLTSLYPAATVLLAVVVLRERLTRLQVAGVGAAIVAVTCIAANP